MKDLKELTNAIILVNYTLEHKIRKILLWDIIYNILLGLSLKEVAVQVSSSERTLERIMREAYPNLTSHERWYNKLAFLVGKRFCSEGSHYVKASDFYNNRHICKQCDKTITNTKRLNDPEKARTRSRQHYLDNKDYYKARNSIQRKRLRLATPSWANLEAIQVFYTKCPEGYEVDHIVPLKGSNVSGLHVISNLQYLTIEENRVKYNKF